MLTVIFDQLVRKLIKKSSSGAKNEEFQAQAKPKNHDP
jgi:hypothetical protein